MLNLLNRYATPLITGFFVVSAVSGVALFFHWAPATFHSMHVWLSMVLLVPFVLHLIRNWRPMIHYARRKTLLIPLLFSLAVAIPFAVSNAGHARGGNPLFRAAALLTGAPLTDLAPILRTTPAALKSALEKQGYTVVSTASSLDQIAEAAGRPGRDLLFRVMPEPAARR